MSENDWKHRHLLAIDDLSPQDIRNLLRVAEGFADISTRSIKKVPALRGHVVVNLFFEDSTRTSNSFKLAAQRLSADVLDFHGKVSSVSKGETLVDTARNIEAMGVDVMVVRHHHSGAAARIAKAVDCAVINAGDGQHEHPTQALLDVYTICHRLNRFETLDLSGKTVAIVGDIAHSRVARSGLIALQKLGAQVVLVGPPTLLPKAFAEFGCELSHSLDEVLPRVDVLNMLRVQFERIAGQAFPSSREYAAFYGLTPQRLRQAKDDVVVMHPGPMNRGLEIDAAVADGPKSAVLQQVSNGLAVRMAALFLVTRPHTTAHAIA
jgi:aspartate carbamoyltransferase catalytic subunit